MHPCNVGLTWLPAHQPLTTSTTTTIRRSRFPPSRSVFLPRLPTATTWSNFFLHSSPYEITVSSPFQAWLSVLVARTIVTIQSPRLLHFLRPVDPVSSARTIPKPTSPRRGNLSCCGDHATSFSLPLAHISNKTADPSLSLSKHRRSIC